MKNLLILSLCLCLALVSLGQIGGESTYKFLNMSPSARISALGGQNVGLSDHDLSVQLSNPAALNPSMHRRVAFGTALFAGNSNFGNVSYAHKFKIPGTFGFGLQYMAYGKFKETDVEGNMIGQFNAGEMNLYAGYGYQFGKILSAGVNAKFVYSQLGPYNSIGMATDLAFMVNDTSRRISASLVAKNVGAQLKSYQPGNREALPFDLQAGLAVGFKGVPFRLHLTIHNLHRWDIRYNNPADEKQDNLFGADPNQKPKKYIGDKLFRHVILGVEFNIKKVVRLDIAYNHLRQQELRLTTRRGVPGLSFGLGLHIKQFDFAYGLMPMAQGATQNQLTISVNTAGFVKKKSQ